MKRQVRYSGADPQWASTVNCVLPARAVAAARLPAQQVSGFLATVAAEIFLQQVDHRPEVAGLLDIDLEQVAQIVERRRRGTEPALLLDRGGFGVALHGDQPAQHRA